MKNLLLLIAFMLSLTAYSQTTFFGETEWITKDATLRADTIIDGQGWYTVENCVYACPMGSHMATRTEWNDLRKYNGITKSATGTALVVSDFVGLDGVMRKYNYGSGDYYKRRYQNQWAFYWTDMDKVTSYVAIRKGKFTLGFKDEGNSTEMRQVKCVKNKSLIIVSSPPEIIPVKQDTGFIMVKIKYINNEMYFETYTLENDTLYKVQ
ncbi:hypothetical protein DRO61_12050 [Candidatus Bathyarchaeota archaeon]|nr:MAG: hypothetical protein DRO61_12050 [Candidatus Bathyarchaeota archaeon]